MALVYIAGLVAAHVIGRRLIGLAHRILEFIPLVKTIYGTTRTAVELISSNNNPQYSSVVLVEFPRPGCQAIGLVTSQVVNAEGDGTPGSIHPHHTDTVLRVPDYDAQHARSSPLAYRWTMQ